MSFDYQSLNDSTAEIRLLQILLGDADSQTMECELLPVRLDKAFPEFAAISYTWETSNEMKDIHLNGSLFAVRENVWELLWELHSSRLNKQPNFIWIDSICINQNDVRERNHQVKFMRNIYSSAKVVLIWLGSATNDSDLAMDYLDRLTWCRLGQKNRKRNDVALINLHNEGLNERHDTRGFSYFGDPKVDWSFHPPVSDAVIALFSRRYWRRIWIIQEVFLARDVLLLCGSKQTTWDKLNNLFNGLQYNLVKDSGRFYKHSWNSNVMETNAYTMVNEKAYFEKKPERKLSGIPLTTLIGSFKDFECTNMRDKVYGLIGLSSDDINIDYRKSIAEVYNDVLTYAVKTKQVDNHAKGVFFARTLQLSLGISVPSAGIVDINTLFARPKKTESVVRSQFFWEKGGQFPGYKDLAWPLPSSKPFWEKEGQFPTPSTTLDTWAHSTDATERFYVDGTKTGRVFFARAGEMADWEAQYKKASR